jgi:uncharacterized protein YegP (UPF0339 family)
MKFEIYSDLGGSWRWRARAQNKKLVAASGESFAQKHNAIRAAKAFVRSLISANFKNKIKYEVEVVEKK